MATLLAISFNMLRPQKTLTSAQFLKVSCGPQPRAPVPLSHMPQLLALKENCIEYLFIVPKQILKCLTSHIGPPQNTVLAGKTLGQQDSHIEFTALGTNLQLVAAVGETQTMLVKAVLRFSTKGVQVAQMEFKVTQMVGGDLHTHTDGIGCSVALGNDTSAAILTANLVGTGLSCREVVSAQSALSTIICLGL